MHPFACMSPKPPPSYAALFLTSVLPVALWRTSVHATAVTVVIHQASVVHDTRINAKWQVTDNSSLVRVFKLIPSYKSVVRLDLRCSRHLRRVGLERGGGVRHVWPPLNANKCERLANAPQQVSSCRRDDSVGGTLSSTVTVIASARSFLGAGRTRAHICRCLLYCVKFKHSSRVRAGRASV